MKRLSELAKYIVSKYGETLAPQGYVYSSDEVEELVSELDDAFENCKMDLSGMWLKRTDCEVEEMIAGTDGSDSEKPLLLLGRQWASLEYAFKNYTYLDGTPFGVKE